MPLTTIHFVLLPFPINTKRGRLLMKTHKLIGFPIKIPDMLRMAKYINESTPQCISGENEWPVSSHYFNKLHHQVVSIIPIVCIPWHRPLMGPQNIKTKEAIFITRKMAT
jgi:hypothetical protein